MIADYLASVLGAAGYEPIQAGSLARARRLLEAAAFDLWLCDRHLPDGDSRQLLARSPATQRPPAIALSADLDEASRSALLAAGFAEVLAKPCPPDRLLASVARVLGHPPPSTGMPVREAGGRAASPAAKATGQEADAGCRHGPALDDAAGLRACAGNRTTLSALRRLFAAEIDGLRQRLAGFIDHGDDAGLAGELHRLAASAAWCGAPRVARCAGALQATLAQPQAAAAARDLDQALQRLASELAS